MIYILHDYPYKGDSLKIGGGKSRLNNAIALGSPRTNPKIVGWIRGVWNALRISKRGDTLICRFDFQAVLIWWIVKLTLRKRNIIATNLMLKYKETIRNKVVRKLYKVPLKASNFRASVISPAYGDLLNKQLGLRVNYTLVHDIYDLKYCRYDGETIPKSIFCGGYNGRDWHFIIDLARELPDVSFHIVMPQKTFENLNTPITANVNIYCNIPKVEFYDLLNQCYMVCIPLNTDAPAGLLVMFRAASQNKLVITTRTATTVEYFKEDCGECLPKDLKLWSNSVRYYLAHPEEARRKGEALRQYLSEACSRENFRRGVESMLWYD